MRQNFPTRVVGTLVCGTLISAVYTIRRSPTQEQSVLGFFLISVTCRSNVTQCK